MTHTGEITALSVAVFWTITALSFEYASVRVGSLAVNFIRLLFALLFLCIFTWFSRGIAFPIDATPFNWGWLIVSGLIGFTLGDLCLFKSFTIIGSRFAMLIMTLVPPITALIGWIMLGEILTSLNFLGMTLTFTGIVMAVISKKTVEDRRLLKLPLKGLLLALGGAVGQAIGLVFSKYGMGTYNAFAATQIRIIAGIVGFGIIIFMFKRVGRITQAFSNKKGLTGIVIGSFFGPFLGVSLSLYSIQHTSTGVASTIMATVPILIILPSFFLFKQKITTREIIGAFISVVGVALFFI